MDIFEKATKIKLRFSINGVLTTEQVWDLTEDTLISQEEKMTEDVEKYEKASRRKPKTKTKTLEQDKQELRLSIITHILDKKIVDREQSSKAMETKSHNQRIMEKIKEAESKELDGKTPEQLRELLK